MQTSRYQRTLSRFANKSRERKLVSQSGIDFSSNDYLALSNSERIKHAIRTAIDNGVPVGSGGSRLLRGNHDVFEQLEVAAASFFNSDQTLYFNSGYVANLAIFTTLPQPQDLILYDERVHASVLDGIKASRASHMAMRHNDVAQIANTISEWRKKGGLGHPWVAVESLYSMEGDFSPLPDLLAVLNQHDGFLVIDDAHATGVFGANGRGLSATLGKQENIIALHTCGKALGVSGALLCVNSVFYQYLINRARAFIFTTAPSPLLAVGVSESLKIMSDEPEHITRLKKLVTYANEQLNDLTGIEGSGSQILPVIIGKNDQAMRIAHRMQTLGFDIRAIRPPTVSEGTARLRLSITLHVNEEKIHKMLTHLSYLIKES